MEGHFLQEDGGPHTKHPHFRRYYFDRLSFSIPNFGRTGDASHGALNTMGMQQSKRG